MNDPAATPHATAAEDGQLAGDAERRCAALLTMLRWPDGFNCPYCGDTKAWSVRRGQWKCRSCHRQTSVTAGTVFAGTRVPLLTWFLAIWLIAHQRQRVNDVRSVTASQLHRRLGLASYQTAWVLLDKLRIVMAEEVRSDYLRGRVVIGVCDEIGESSSHVPGVMLVAVESRGGQWLHRVRLARAETLDEFTVEAFTRQVVQTTADVLTTDGVLWRGVQAAGFPPRLVASAPDADTAVARLAAVFGRWWTRTHRGAASGAPTERHLAEFSYCFNRRRARDRDQLWQRFVTRAAVTEPGARSPARERLSGSGLVERSG